MKIYPHDLPTTAASRMRNNGRLAGPAFQRAVLRAKNCIVTPHIARATREAHARLLDTTVANLKAFFDGHPVNVVN